MKSAGEERSKERDDACKWRVYVRWHLSAPTKEFNVRGSSDSMSTQYSPWAKLLSRQKKAPSTQPSVKSCTRCTQLHDTVTIRPATWCETVASGQEKSTVRSGEGRGGRPVLVGEWLLRVRSSMVSERRPTW